MSEQERCSIESTHATLLVPRDSSTPMTNTTKDRSSSNFRSNSEHFQTLFITFGQDFWPEVLISLPNIYDINDKMSPEGATYDYEAHLKHLVERKIIPILNATGFPKFDLILLGMEPDGHMALLFPTYH
ncbi:putative 6-phosphogluconolactonase [Forsythia ovata]|uniref:6-phosphogluconolactonase n=1 Tax=Forsythia ovata TaxID=205694 RepID=A0ABD1XA35_9LAMI